MSRRRDKGPSKEQIEREAAAELNRLTSRSQVQAHDAPDRAWSGNAPRTTPGPPTRVGGGAPVDDVDDDGDWEEYGPDDEEMAVTEMALQQLAERRGGGRDLNDFAIRADRGSAEAARDRALRQVLDRQERRAEQKRYNPLSPWKQERWVVGGPKADAEDDPDAEEEPPAWADAMSRPGDRLSVGRRGDDDEPTKAKKPKAKKGKSPAKGAAKKAPAKKAPAKDAAAKKAPAKGAAKKAPAKDAVAKKAPAKDAVAKKAPAKGAVAKKAPAKGAVTKKAPAKGAAKKAPAKDAAKKAAKKAPAKGAVTKKAPKKTTPPREP